MRKEEIEQFIHQYMMLSHDIWKMGEVLVRDEIGESLTNDQLYLLRFIDLKGKCTSTDLAEAFLVKKSAITASVHRLVEKGYVARVPDERDRRITFLMLTKEGKTLFDQTNAKVYKLVESFITEFDHKEISQFIATFEKLAEILRQRLKTERG